ncbi:MAG TPA: cytochrome c3 family protein [Candidatus Limnocylindrales bacterium]|nr:cytochrome c3 family protein [Candidatus Limnocylindrales bacterium]
MNRHRELWACSRSLVLVAVWSLCVGLPVSAQTKNSCLDCHPNLPEPLGVSVETYSQNIHGQKGLTCAACHGGDASSDDPERAMSRAAGWKGKIERKQIPELCASCHSDAERMKKYNPGLRVDQFQQYKTSVHGQKWAKSDTKVAVCTDCHGVHDLRAPSDPRSSVHPTNIATTCSHCHADADYMKPYGIKTDQFANYQQSVHHDAMMVRGDLSAPTCTTCHGNHGATPPGVASVTNVCSNCHVFQAQLFGTSPHKDAFAAAGLPGCVTCHSNHGIKHPTDDLIGTGQKSACIQCHADGDAGFVQARAMHDQLETLQSAIVASQDILERAERQGMEVSQPMLQQAQARDALLKARVTVHAFHDSELKRDTEAGLAVTRQTYVAGEKALEEGTYRRVGLGLSLVMIALTLVGLGLYIRNLEQK